MKRKYNKSKIITVSAPDYVNGDIDNFEISEKELLRILKSLRFLYIQSNRDKEKYQRGMCYYISRMHGYNFSTYNVVAMRVYLHSKAPPKEEHDGDFWWPRYKIEPRIQFLNARISELEISIKEHETQI